MDSASKKREKANTVEHVSSEIYLDSLSARSAWCLHTGDTGLSTPVLTFLVPTPLSSPQFPEFGCSLFFLQQRLLSNGQKHKSQFPHSQFLAHCFLHFGALKKGRNLIGTIGDCVKHFLWLRTQKAGGIVIPNAVPWHNGLASCVVELRFIKMVSFCKYMEVFSAGSHVMWGKQSMK